MLRSNMGAIFGLRQLIVGGKAYDSAKEGQTYSGSFIWPDDYALVFKQHPGGFTRRPGLGLTMLWEDLSPLTINVKQYREEGSESDIFRVRHYMDEMLFNAYCGHLLQVDA